MNDIEVARSSTASPLCLHNILSKYRILDRNMGEALVLNPSLDSNILELVLEKCSIELRILALKHPNITSDQQFNIISSIKFDHLRTKAKTILLQRVDLDINIIAVLCLDPEIQIRQTALELLKRRKNDQLLSKI